MQAGLNQKALDRFFAQGFERLKPVQPLYQHEILTIRPNPDRGLLTLFQYAFGKLCNLGRIKRLGAFGRHPDTGNGEGDFDQHGGFQLGSVKPSTMRREGKGPCPGKAMAAFARSLHAITRGRALPGGAQAPLIPGEEA
jgi:hypothetical protein